ncbi:hypothetical protein GCM10017772_43010 [Promicromonospora soli]|uniref:Uncharacterized protein n=1 Tax=Promicromonospora soli TaxID=2035533 RepID=A0A919G661_9MICO|nr:hypothetical protein GCM10017772_43010 [Promicromonospora soli]
MEGSGNVFGHGVIPSWGHDDDRHHGGAGLFDEASAWERARKRCEELDASGSARAFVLREETGQGSPLLCRQARDETAAVGVP